jgi:hypothetical protein
LIHWFNPLVWYAFQLMRTDRELACDQVALGQLSRSEASTMYGQTIIRILEFNRCHPLRAAIAGMGQTRHQVRKRIVSIAEFRPSCEGIQWGAACLLACLAVTGLTRTPMTAATRAHRVSETVVAQETPPVAPASVSTPAPPQKVAQNTAAAPALTRPVREQPPSKHSFMLSQKYTVTSPQSPQPGRPQNAAAMNAQMWSQYHYQVQAQLNARQMQMAQNSFIRQQRRTASATASRRRKRPTQNGIPGIVEMAARQNALNRRTQ